MYRVSIRLYYRLAISSGWQDPLHHIMAMLMFHAIQYRSWKNRTSLSHLSGILDCCAVRYFFKTKATSCFHKLCFVETHFTSKNYCRIAVDCYVEVTFSTMSDVCTGKITCLQTIINYSSGILYLKSNIQHKNVTKLKWWMEWMDYTCESITESNKEVTYTLEIIANAIENWQF